MGVQELSIKEVKGANGGWWYWVELWGGINFVKIGYKEENLMV